MRCNNCGQEYDGPGNCPYCGCGSSTMNYDCGASSQPLSKPDNGGFGWGLLGCCIPIAGLILYLVWKEEKPKTAKSVGIGALINVCSGAILWLMTAFSGCLIG